MLREGGGPRGEGAAGGLLAGGRLGRSSPFARLTPRVPEARGDSLQAKYSLTPRRNGLRRVGGGRSVIDSLALARGLTPRTE